MQGWLSIKQPVYVISYVGGSKEKIWDAKRSEEIYYLIWFIIWTSKRGINMRLDSCELILGRMVNSVNSS